MIPGICNFHTIFGIILILLMDWFEYNTSQYRVVYSNARDCRAYGLAPQGEAAGPLFRFGEKRAGLNYRWYRTRGKFEDDWGFQNWGRGSKS